MQGHLELTMESVDSSVHRELEEKIVSDGDYSGNIFPKTSSVVNFATKAFSKFRLSFSPTREVEGDDASVENESEKIDENKESCEGIIPSRNPTELPVCKSQVKSSVLEATIEEKSSYSTQLSAREPLVNYRSVPMSVKERLLNQARQLKAKHDKERDELLRQIEIMSRQNVFRL
jgi:hypothetical protein